MSEPFTLRPDHFTVLTDDLAATQAFYADILDLRPGPRPALSRPGLWLYADDPGKGGSPILHVIETKPLPEPRRGVLDHMAFRGPAGGVDKLTERLEARGLAYTRKPTPAPWRQWQVFFEDPNGAAVEVDFDFD